MFTSVHVVGVGRLFSGSIYQCIRVHSTWLSLPWLVFLVYHGPSAYYFVHEVLAVRIIADPPIRPANLIGNPGSTPHLVCLSAFRSFHYFSRAT